MDQTKRDRGARDAGARKISSDKHRRGRRIGSFEKSKSESRPLLRALRANLVRAREPGLRQRLTEAVAEIERQAGREERAPQ
jgi:hypothetical protein